MNCPPASYLNSSVMGNYLLNWSGLINDLFVVNNCYISKLLLYYGPLISSRYIAELESGSKLISSNFDK